MELLNIDLKKEQDIELLRKAAIAWQEEAATANYNLKIRIGEANIDELKKIVDFDKAKKIIK